MHYSWKHYTKEQIVGDNYWRHIAVDTFGLANVLDEVRGSFIIGDDVYIIGFNRNDENYVIGGKEYEDNYDIANEDYELQLNFEDIKPYITEGTDNPYCSFDFRNHNCDIDDIASDIIAMHGLVSALEELEDADIYPYSTSIRVDFSEG